MVSRKSYSLDAFTGVTKIMNELDLLKNIETVESHISRFSKRIRELLFDENYQELSLYISDQAVSIRDDLDNMKELSNRLSALQVSKANEPKQLELPL